MTVDDEKLFKLFEALDPKQRKKAIKGALTRAGSKLRKAAVENLMTVVPKTGKGKQKSSPLKAGKEMAKGIRRVNYKDKIGFRVTIGTKKRKKGSKGPDYGYYTNSRGLTKPVLIWAEGGTDKRDTKTGSSWRGSRRKRRGHYTGRMPRYGFMEKTKTEMAPKVEAMLKEEINLNIQRIAKKYGCTIS